MTKILVLCTGNSCRSQIAEGFLTKMVGNDVKIFSAGIEAHGLNPRAVKCMNEIGIDISTQTSDLIQSYLNENIQHVITVCDSAAEKCPIFPTVGQIHHNSFPDPAKASGTEDEIMDEFRAVRESIKDYCQNFVEEFSL